jgi:gamma-glutamyltranspeptidase/glutathione hydrolase
MRNRMTFFLFFIVVLTNSACSISKPVSMVLRPEQSEHTLAISTSEPLASNAAAGVFEKGGNIADAAVAASLAIAVIRPQSTGIGGGGFLVFHRAKNHRTETWDFRETAPLLSTKDMFLKNGEVIPEASTIGAKAVATPGLIAGLYEFHKKFGKLKWAEVVQPSIDLAGSEISVSAHMAFALEDMKTAIASDPEMKRLFFKGEEPLVEGDHFVQLDLQQTLKSIAEMGPSYFYEGEFSRRVSEWMEQKGGLITQKDFSSYQIKMREPLSVAWHGMQIETMPPPSSGGLHLLQILKIVEDLSENYKKQAPPLVPEIEAMKRAFADRAYLLGDPDFADVPVKQLLSPAYLSSRAQEIETNKVLPSEEIFPWSHESLKTQTTQLSFVDSEGNAISTTQSVNSRFGAVVMVPRTGVVLNNTMDDFSIKPGQKNYFGLIGGEVNRIEPAKRPVSSMTPTIVLDSKKNPILVLGAPGGSRIISSVYFVLSRFLRDGRPLDEALSDCRFHHQWIPDSLLLEGPCFERFQSLKEIYSIEASKPYTFGEVQVVGKNPDGTLLSASDPRGVGHPLFATHAK